MPATKTKTTTKTIVKKTIVEKKNRGVLHEGRDNGMAFGFLKKAKNGVFETVQPLSPCKDYLAEVVMTENTGIPTRAHGLKYTAKLNIFEKKVAYLGIKLMKTKYDAYHMNKDGLEADVKLLNKNYKNIQKLLNEFEDKMDMKKKTKIQKVNDNYFLVTVPIEWCKSSVSISLYSLLMRAGMQSDGTKDLMTFMKEFKMGLDTAMVKDAIEKVEKILEKKEMPPDPNNYKKSRLLVGSDSPHDNGIGSWKGSFVPGTIIMDDAPGYVPSEDEDDDEYHDEDCECDDCMGW